MFRRGDIVAVKGKQRERALNRLISPYTDRWHHFIVGDPVARDFVIYESMPDGVRCGRLSFYKGADLVIYRVADEAIASRAAHEASRFGRRYYDYALYGRLLAQAVGYWIAHGFRPVPYMDFQAPDDEPLICTELVRACYSAAGLWLVPRYVAPTPSALHQAALDGKYERINYGIL